MNTAMLGIFIPTFFLVSITPGMCMTLALTLGMSIGYRKTLWMMLGELAGVALVAITAVIGIAAVMVQFPWLFLTLKFIGGVYLIYLGIQMWCSKGKLALNVGGETSGEIERKELGLQGFVTAIANPKGWAFMISLLPPFIDNSLDITPQLIMLVAVILLFEFICMSLYALGGKGLTTLLSRGKNVRILNRIAGSLMMLVGGWLFIG
ncbi:LysE family translocator [Vibrio caribbeanicus]|uniref:LysE family translocator n=1 Tax=Vibrio caribbeanicus TaxID=701175 RepID=UPI0030DAF340